MGIRGTGRRSFGFPFEGRPDNGGLNVTPIVDIVFLLIIFFLVVCQFIEAENLPVSIPDGCKFAQREPEPGGQVTTVTVMRTFEDEVGFAVGSERICEPRGGEGLVSKLVRLIDARLKKVPPEERVITLRIDRDVCFAEAQYALAGVAASCAADIQLAVLKDKRGDGE
ncbi:MAG: biopolymer transporter ExbD [Planctomycetota bacterium]|jgi:biopolymer transport protein ExbD